MRKIHTKIILGDSRNMQELKNESVHLVVTSPPYWQFKDYGKGGKVFIKFDSTKYDHQGNLLCYLYFRNKTFINAHLIKNALADVDTSLNFKYKSKFIDLQDNSNKEAIG